MYLNKFKLILPSSFPSYSIGGPQLIVIVYYTSLVMWSISLEMAFKITRDPSAIVRIITFTPSHVAGPATAKVGRTVANIKRMMTLALKVREKYQ